eukprot:m.8509 g.8509  ORF g.8509 m.8509 type:complete len:144 (-) comp6529_c0_seq2:288-719(-)
MCFTPLFHCCVVNFPWIHRYRYKGVLAVKGMNQKFVFQGVGMLFSGGFVDTRWRRKESRECRFVFIGKRLDTKALIDGFMECKVKPLRFKVGDIVEANIGQFVRGKILKCWDEGNAYRVEIDDDEKTNVFAPIDEDEYIRPSA